MATKTSTVFHAVERTLRRCTRDGIHRYEVRGGHSYLAKIPRRFLAPLAAALPHVFTTDDWNVLADDTQTADEVVRRIARAVAGHGVVVEVRDTSTKNVARRAVFVDGVQVAFVVDAFNSSRGKDSEACGHKVEVVRGVRFSSLCNAVVQLTRSLEATSTFTKKDKSELRLRAILSLARRGDIEGAASRPAAAALRDASLLFGMAAGRASPPEKK